MNIIDLGLTEFLDTYKIQLDLVQDVSEKKRDNTVLVTRHYPVITAGRLSDAGNILLSEEELLSKGINIVNIDRGGDVTYHGFGQLVLYPIVRLENEARDIHLFLEYLEEVGIRFLSKYGVFGVRKHGFRGVWVGQDKIASIGIGVKKWTTYHGMAINITSDKDGFSFIRPCGIESVNMTSLTDILGRKIGFEDAKAKAIASFEEISLLDKAVSKK
ncbi:MAG: lipoyl(octanoyl) transferase LipB [Candidatus Omnitrophota bacterium]